MNMHKKGTSLFEMPHLVIAIIILVLVLGIGAGILGTIGKGQCTGTGYSWDSTNQLCDQVNSTGAVLGVGGSLAYNSTHYGESGITVFAGWVPTIAIVLAASVVIGLVMAYLSFRKQE
jgi:hypothetical protein